MKTNPKATMSKHHFLLISYCAQGHINPTLRLAKHLIKNGSQVTFATTVHGFTQIKSLPSPQGLSYATFSDGFDDGNKPSDDPCYIMDELKRVGSRSLADLILSLSRDQDKPVTFLIYSLILPWAAQVARELGIPSAFFCIQSATALAIYNHYFNRQEGKYQYYKHNPPSFINLHGMPPFSSQDLPSFLWPNSPHTAIVPSFQEHIEELENDPKPCVLLNTVDALEPEAIRAVRLLNPITVGPLIPSGFFEDDDHSDESFSCDLFERSEDYIQWLDSKQDRSVVYVSFGSMVVLQSKQMMETFQGLLETCRPFLWVIRSPKNAEEEEARSMIRNELHQGGYLQKGLIVPWCSQAEVLGHRSVGCFMTHCGWNSVLESLAAGIPTVGYPHFSDQITNAKLMEEIWGTGVRVRGNKEGIIDREEVKRCVNMVMCDGESDDIRRNVKKWKSLIKESAKEQGSSRSNLKLFMESIGEAK